MIDVHTHVVSSMAPGSKPGPSEESVLDQPLETVAERLRAEMKAAGVTQALAMGVRTAPPDDVLGINATLRLTTLVPGLHAVGFADPTRGLDTYHMKRVEGLLEAGRVKGLKAYLGYVPTGPLDEGYRPYYRLAAKYKLPILFHTGDTWSTTAKLKHAHPLLVDEVAVEHPETRFVMAHFGNPWVFDAAEVVYKNPNVWADLSGLVVGTKEGLAKTFGPDGHPLPRYARLHQRVQDAFEYAERPDRFLYGSDWPLVPMAVYRAIIAALVPLDAHAAVFRENAAALFGLG